MTLTVTYSKNILDFAIIVINKTLIFLYYKNNISICVHITFREHSFKKLNPFLLMRFLILMGRCAFASNSAITSIKFNKTNSKLKSIGIKSFYSAGLVGEIQFPDSLEILSNDCFANNKLTSVTLP